MITPVLSRNAPSANGRSCGIRTRSCRVVVAALSIAVISLTHVPSTSASPRTQDSGPVALSALETTSKCVQETKNLRALLLIDESGSLKKTDPENRRVTAAKTAIESLAGLAEHEIDGQKPTVEVSVAGFAVDYNEIAPWTSTNYQSVRALEDQVDALAERNRGVDTDYAAALIGAKASLQARAAAQPKPACAVILWFTDGKYDIEPGVKRSEATKAYAPSIRLDQTGGAEALLEAGRDILCRRDGLVDQLRTDGVATVALGLTVGLPLQDQAFLAALATGKGPEGATCGAQDGSSFGAFIPVSDLSELIASLDIVASMLARGVPGSTQTTVPICDGQVCEDGKRAFPVDVGMSRVRITVQTGGTDVAVRLQTPGGEETFAPSVGPGSPNHDVGGLAIRVVWLSSDVVSFDANLPADSASWAGDWTITLIGKPSSTDEPSLRASEGFRVFYFGALLVRPRADDPNSWELAAGRTGPRASARVIAETEISLKGDVSGANGEIQPVTLVAAKDGSVAVSGPDRPVAGSTLKATVSMTTRSGIVFSTVSTAAYSAKPGSVVSATTTVPIAVVDPEKPKEKSTVVPLLGGIGVALVAGIVGAVLFIRSRRRSAFSQLENVQVCVGRIRISQDRIAQSRITWLSDVGSESLFRLNRSQFSRRLEGRPEQFALGVVHFVKTKDGAVAQSGSNTLVVGEPGKSVPYANPREAVISDRVAPQWIFAGSPARSEQKGRAHIEEDDPDATYVVPRTGATNAVSSPGYQDRAYEGDLVVCVRNEPEIALIERQIAETLALRLFASEQDYR